MVFYRRIDHVALHVADVDTSVRFYENHFGFKTYFLEPPKIGIEIAYLRLGDTVLELAGHADAASGGFHFCLETDDFEGAVTALRGAGVRIVTEPHKTTPRIPREEGWRRAVFKGPDGELIEIRG